MKTNQFLELLKTNSHLSLKFLYPEKENSPFNQVPSNFHITEVKNQKIESVDCGGSMARFNETVVQLVSSPTGKSEEPWKAKKALAILEKVNNKSPMDAEAEIYVEYSPSNKERIIFDVSNIRADQAFLTITLQHFPTVCKPSFFKSGIPVGACC